MRNLCVLADDEINEEIAKLLLDLSDNKEDLEEIYKKKIVFEKELQSINDEIERIKKIDVSINIDIDDLKQELKSRE